MVILQGIDVREVGRKKLLWRRNGLVCSGPGQRLGHISGVRSAAKNYEDGNEEQDKNYKNNERMFTFFYFLVFFHRVRVSIKVKMSTKCLQRSCAYDPAQGLINGKGLLHPGP